VACDVVDPKTIGDSHVNEPFIERQELVEILRGAPLSIAQKRDTYAKVRDHARRQIIRGRVGVIGEVILEGPVNIDIAARFMWGSVAYSSLANAISATCRPGNPMADFLRQKFGASSN